MNGWIVLAIVAGVIVLALIANRFGWIDLSNKNHNGGSSGSGAFGIGDEVFNPSRYEAQVELDRQTTLPAPAPTPGDPATDTAGVPDNPPGQYAGRVSIDLSKKR